MSLHWRNPLHAQPFDEPVPNRLAEEFAAMPWPRRMQAMRKAALRELTLFATGQARRRVRRVPPGVTAVLWVYTLTTVGDAIMDLAPRTIVPQRIALDLLVAPALAPLFRADRRVRAVYTDRKEMTRNVDFVLLDSLRTPVLRLKRQSFPGLPFTSMAGHMIGERIDRAAYADRRIRQLFGLPSGEVTVPTLDLGDAGGSVYDEEHFRIAVPLGARLARKRYLRWNEVLRDIVAQWPRSVPPPEFHFLGQGSSARKDLHSIDEDIVVRRSVVKLDSGDLRKAAFDIGGCDAFLGVDGGLMHVAMAVGTPGLGLFARIDPSYFLRAGSSMRAMCSDGEVSELDADKVAAEFLSVLPGLVSARRAELPQV